MVSSASEFSEEDISTEKHSNLSQHFGPASTFSNRPRSPEPNLLGQSTWILTRYCTPWILSSSWALFDDRYCAVNRTKVKIPESSMDMIQRGFFACACGCASFSPPVLQKIHDTVHHLVHTASSSTFMISTQPEYPASIEPNCRDGKPSKKGAKGGWIGKATHLPLPDCESNRIVVSSCFHRPPAWKT